MKIKYFLYMAMFLLLSGCATQEKIASGVGSVESNTQTAAGETQKVYTDVKYGTKKVINSIGNGWSNIYSAVLENPAVQIMVPDEYILKNRKNLVIWSSQNSISFFDKKLDSISDLTKYYFTIEQDKYKKNFLKNHPKPKFDKYQSDARNLSRFYDYEVALRESKYEWDLGLEQLKKKIVSKSLQSFYGKPELKFITYNPNFLSKKISFSIGSQKNNFKETISLKVDPDVAKELEQNINKIKTFIYFDTTSENNIELVGVSLLYNKKEYMAQITQNVNVYKSDLRVEGSQLDYTNEELDYALMNKEIKKPNWYLEYESSNEKIVGLGYHVTLEKARQLARINLAGKIKGYKAKVSSENKKELARDGNGNGSYSQNYKSEVKIESNVDFRVKDIKDEKYNEIFFVAVEEIK